MSDNYNYGPRMSFEKLDDFQSAKTPYVASTYLGGLPASSVSTKSSPVVMSAASTTTLGSHWKKRSPVSSSSPAPSSLDLSSVNSAVTSRSRSSEATIQRWGSSSKSSSGSTYISSASTDSSRSEKLEEARALLEERDMRDCLHLHSRGLDEVDEILREQVDVCIDRYVELEVDFHEQKKELKRMRSLWQNYHAALQNITEEAREEIDAKSNELLDSVSLTLHEFMAKEKFEKFVRKHEGAYEHNLNMMAVMEENERRIKNIQKLIMKYRYDNGPLTVFEHEDIRIDEVYRQLIAMMEKLPLSKHELNDMKHFIEKTDEHFEYSKIYKCDLICRRLFSTMGTWHPAPKSDDWRSVCNLNAGVYSSSFALSDLSDAKLADLDGELRAAQVRRAVEGPNEVIEMSPWSSLVTGYSSSGEKLVASNSLGEPMSLSSYEYESSDQGHTTCSTLSGMSMPFYENTSIGPTLNTSTVSMKTALSAGSPVVIRAPRENHNDKEDTTVGSRTPDSTSISLETIEEAIKTAKAISETQAGSLLDALKNSANQCGVEMSELMTAVSSGSESISDTQSTSSSQNFLAH